MIAILLATYNGEKYIAEQIESLLAQTEQDFVIYISDDCSTDNTYEVICQYAKKYPDKIVETQNVQNTGSAKYNFFWMMIEQKQDYVMLCDQDDVWKPDKIALTLQKMRAMEAEHGKVTPLLVHTDLEVVDEELKTISPSFRYAMNANYNRTQLKDALIQNTLTGCTVMYNRALSNLIVGTPKYMIMHDWWLMLVAGAFGEMGHVDTATILYRQHEDNAIGAKNVRALRYKMNKLIHGHEIKRAIAQTYIQANAFLQIYKDKLCREQVDLLEQYCKIPNLSKWKRWGTICRLGVLKNGIARKIAHFIFI